eukprot:6205519-Pyramimonas_sp.AAC.1
MRGANVQNTGVTGYLYQRCEHPGFPGASSVCNVLVPGGGLEGNWGELSVKVDAREPQNPTKSEEYQRHPQ